MKNKRPIIITAIVVFLLLIPAIAMQFTDEIKWTLLDFVVAAVLLLGAGLSCDFIIRKVKKLNLRISLFVATFAFFLLIWMQLAVGILG